MTTIFSVTKSIRKQSLILLTGCFVLLSCKKEKTRICKLYESKVDYAVGTVKSINTSPLKATYKYSYVVRGTEYEGKEKAYGIGQGDNGLVNTKFVVIYALEDPSNSDLNTDFPIKTEQDLDNFKTKYQTGPPTPDFPNNCK